MKKLILISLALILSLLTLLLIGLMVSRLSMPYNEEGIYFDEESSVTYNSQALVVINSATLISSLLTALLIVWLIKLRHKKSSFIDQ